jgi:magnesium chelatase subunit I
VILSGGSEGYSRIGDLVGVVPAITGKIELVYEGEQEGPAIVAQKLISKAIRKTFSAYFPNPEHIKRNDPNNPYRDITHWFGKGNMLDLVNDDAEDKYKRQLEAVPGLKALVKAQHPKASAAQQLLMMEFVLHGLAEFSLLGKQGLESGTQFKDLLSGMLNIPEDDDDSEYGGYYEDEDRRRR